jgi:hypothetical protein
VDRGAQRGRGVSPQLSGCVTKGRVAQGTVHSPRAAAMSLRPPPQTAVVKIVEVEVAVELRSLLVDRVDNDGASSELSSASHASTERID